MLSTITGKAATIKDPSNNVQAVGVAVSNTSNFKVIVILVR